MIVPGSSSAFQQRRQPNRGSASPALIRGQCRLGAGIAFALLALTAGGAGAQQLQSVRGVVRDTTGVPLEGVDVLVGERRTTTNARGAFQVDSLRAGRYTITVRKVGYAPVLSRIAVIEGETTTVDYYLSPSALVLPVLIAEGRRTGIHGLVRDSMFRPIPGAKVQVAGNRGGVKEADSLGQFSFPRSDRGPYLVRVTRPGYDERRFFVEIKPGESRELSVEMTASAWKPSRIEESAFRDLVRRMAWGRPRERVVGEDLERYGSLGICDIPRIRSEVGRLPGAETTLILNGATVIRYFPVTSLCAWPANKVDLVEFGRDACRDDTGSIAWLLHVWCGVGPRSIQSLRGGGGGTRGSYVVIWEKP